MKELIKDIKRNRLPEELLYLMELVSKCEKRMDNTIVDLLNGHLLYSISYERRRVLVYQTNAYMCLFRKFSNVSADKKVITKLMEDALTNSIYSNYKVVS